MICRGDLYANQEKLLDGREGFFLLLLLQSGGNIRSAILGSSRNGEVFSFFYKEKDYFFIGIFSSVYPDWLEGKGGNEIEY